MKRFSTMDFEGELYVLPGKADQYSIMENEALKERLMEYDKTETVRVYCDVYYLNDGESEVTGDLIAGPELDDITENFVAYLKDGMFLLQESYHYDIPGALPVPFEDYYELQGAEREAFVQAKQDMLKEKAAIRKDFEDAGIPEEDIEQWFRFDYWTDGDDSEEA